jgi:hypothetical protein
VTDHPNTPELAAAMTVARVRAWRTGLLSLHKVLVDAELLRYASAHGPVGGPHHALKLLSEHAWFQWLRPYVLLVVEIDERMADQRPMTTDEAEAFRQQTRALLKPASDSPAGREYLRSLQELPDAVAEHSRLMTLTRETRE